MTCDYTKTTRDGFQVMRRHTRSFRNGYSAWDGWRNDPYWKVVSPAGAEYTFSFGTGFLPLVRRAEPLAQAIREKRIKTERGLRAAYRRTGLPESGLGSEVLFGLRNMVDSVRESTDAERS